MERRYNNPNDLVAGDTVRLMLSVGSWVLIVGIVAIFVIFEYIIK